MKKILILIMISILLEGCSFFGGLNKRVRVEDNKLGGVFSEWTPGPVDVVLFFDFASPQYRDSIDIITQFKNESIGKIKLENRHFISNSSFRIVAESAECAKRQGEFFNFHDEYFDHHFGLYDQDTIREIALRIDLDLDEFDTCLNSGITKEVLENDKYLAKKYGVKSSPTFVFNKQSVISDNNVNIEILTAILEKFFNPPKEKIKKDNSKNLEKTEEPLKNSIDNVETTDQIENVE